MTFPNNKPDKNGNSNFAATKTNHTAKQPVNKKTPKAVSHVQKLNETHHKNKTGQNNMSKALNHTTVPQNMSQKNLTAKSNGTTVTAKNVTKASVFNNSEKFNNTLPQKNISKVAVPSVSDSNKFAK